MGEKKWSYAEFDALVTGTATSLKGVQPGEVVPLYSENPFHYPLFLFALLRRKAIFFPLPRRLPPREWGKFLERLGGKKCILSGKIIPAGAEEFQKVDLLSPSNLIKESKTSAKPLPLDPSAPAVALATSGSTGTPKTALFTYENFFYSVQGLLAVLPLTESDLWLLTLPPDHIGGLSIFFRAAIAGAAVSLPPPKASFSTLLEQESPLPPTYASCVPTQLARLLPPPAEKRSPLSSSQTTRPALSSNSPLTRLRGILLGGAPLSPTLLQGAIPLIPSYGLTEMTSTVTCRTTAGGTLGKPLPHRELFISKGEESETGVGEILVSGKPLFLGYWTKEGLERPLTQEGYFPTGDLGSLDQEGNLTFAGRKDRMFTSGGENIHPEEIEQALCTLPSVRTATVVPVPDPEYGARPVAFLDKKEEVESSLIAHALQELLPSFKIPIAYFPLPHFSQRNSLKPTLSQLPALAEKLLRGKAKE